MRVRSWATGAPGTLHRGEPSTTMRTDRYKGPGAIFWSAPSPLKPDPGNLYFPGPLPQRASTPAVAAHRVPQTAMPQNHNIGEPKRPAETGAPMAAFCVQDQAGLDPETVRAWGFLDSQGTSFCPGEPGQSPDSPALAAAVGAAVPGPGAPAPGRRWAGWARARGGGLRGPGPGRVRRRRPPVHGPAPAVLGHPEPAGRRAAPVLQQPGAVREPGLAHGQRCGTAAEPERVRRDLGPPCPGRDAGLPGDVRGFARGRALSRCGAGGQAPAAPGLGAAEAAAPAGTGRGPAPVLPAPPATAPGH